MLFEKNARNVINHGLYLGSQAEITVKGYIRQGNVKFLVREMVAAPDQTRAGIRWFLSGVS
jgi:hypothetical protein